MNPQTRLLLSAAALGAVHVALLASGGLYASAGAGELALSALSHVGWITALSILGGWFVQLASGRSCVAGTIALAVAVYAAAWFPFTLRQMRIAGSASPEAIVLGVNAAILLSALLIGVLRLRSAAAALRSTRPWALPFILATAAALIPPRMHDLSSGSVVVGAIDQTAELRPAAKEMMNGIPWNILLLSVDTLRADHLGMYGYEKDTSPNLDRLARRGMSFTNALTIRPKTSPAVASLHTGVYPVRHGIHAPATLLDQRQMTLAEYLVAAGYRTGASITNGNLFPTFGFDQGFDHYDYGSNDASTVSDLAIGWLDESINTEEPWFFWAHYTDPHTPYDPPAVHGDRFLDPSATKRSEQLIALYDGEIHYTDSQIGRIIDWLDAHPTIRDRTLIVFTADHGESLGEHDYWFEHGLHPYEASARIPLFFVAPGSIPSEQSTTELASIVDIVPTLLDAVAAEGEAIIQGYSLLPLLTGLSPAGPRDYAFIEAGYGEHIGRGRTRALRRRSTKLVQRLVDWARWPKQPLDLLWALDARSEGGLAADEFYDLESDPQESRSLAIDAIERRLLSELGTSFGSSTFDGPELEAANMDEKSLESLRALGYID